MINGLPERLRLQRESLHYSQKAVAERLNVSMSLIAAYEYGTRTPSVEMLLALSYFYHCSTDYLLGKEENTEKKLNLNTNQMTSLINFINTMQAN